MSFRSSSTNSVVALNLVVTAPAGVSSGDVLIAWMLTDVSTGTFTWPSGFTDVTGSPANCTADAQTLGVAIKIAGGSEPSSYTLTGSQGGIGGVAAWSGDSATQPERVQLTTQNTAQNDPVTMVTTAFGANTANVCDIAIIVGFDVRSSTDATFTAPSGFTKQDDINSGFYNGALFYKDSQASGYAGTESIGGSNGAGATSGWNIFVLALTQTPSGPTPNLPRVVDGAELLRPFNMGTIRR